PPLPAGPDLVWEPAEVRKAWEDEGYQPIALDGASELDPLPAGQPFAFEAQRPAIAARGLAEAENELAGFVRGGNRVVVAFPHRGDALRTQGVLGRIEAELLEAAQRPVRGTASGDGEGARMKLPSEPTLMFAISPARRGFVWRELGLVLLPETQVFRKR